MTNHIKKSITKFIYLAFALFAFACIALLPSAQAVMPPPDGDYPGGNTAEGNRHLLSLTTGSATRQSVSMHSRSIREPAPIRRGC